MSEPDVWDLIVVGAGPAGSAAAHEAASRGARTLLLDAVELPRYKTCGGGLIGVSMRCLADVPDVPVRDEITEVSFSLRGGRPVVRRGGVSMRMVNRFDLDHTLLLRARSAGADFAAGERLLELVEADGVVHVRTSRDTHVARVVVGADGSSGRTSRYVGVEHAVTDLGLELELSAEGVEDQWRHRVHLDWGPLPSSYAWVFPKGDVLTVGVIAERGRPDETRDYLRSFVARMRLGGQRVLTDSGHLTRCRAEGSPLARGNVLVAGDAAGLLEPWTREGISFALRSGRLAGAHAVSDPAGYAGAVLAELGEEMRVGAVARSAFARHPAVFHRLLSRTDLGWRSFERLVGGETTLARAGARWPVRTALRALGGGQGSRSR